MKTLIPNSDGDLGGYIDDNNVFHYTVPSCSWAAGLTFVIDELTYRFIKEHKVQEIRIHLEEMAYGPETTTD